MKLALLLPVALLIAVVANAESRTDVASATQDLLAKGHEPSSSCTELVKECFAYGNEEFLNCLHTSSRHSYCANTQFGTLVAKRWSMSPASTGSDNAPAFTGPQLVDRECIKNFDSQLSGLLTSGELDQDQIKTLQGILNSCNREAPLELMRP